MAPLVNRLHHTLWYPDAFVQNMRNKSVRSLSIRARNLICVQYIRICHILQVVFILVFNCNIVYGKNRIHRQQLSVHSWKLNHCSHISRLCTTCVPIVFLATWSTYTERFMLLATNEQRDQEKVERSKHKFIARWHDDIHSEPHSYGASHEIIAGNNNTVEFSAHEHRINSEVYILGCEQPQLCRQEQQKMYTHGTTSCIWKTK